MGFGCWTKSEVVNPIQTWGGEHIVTCYHGNTFVLNTFVHNYFWILLLAINAYQRVQMK